MKLRSLKRESKRGISPLFGALSFALLFASTYTLGTCAHTTFPYPLLHPLDAGRWMQASLLNFGLLSLGLLTVAFCERFRLRWQILFCAAGLLVFAGAALAHTDTARRAYLLSLLFACVLWGTRATLREFYSLSPVFRAALVTCALVTGSLLGARTPHHLIPGATTGSALAALACAIALWQRFAREAVPISRLRAPARSERFGDRKQDFEAPAPRKARKSVKWQVERFKNFILLNIPMAIISLFLLYAVGNTVYQVLGHRALWESRMRNSAKTFQTKLFLSTCSRRLYEEMAATQRVPHDWESFLAGNFTEDGRPMGDRDAWGTPYELLDAGSEIVLTSAGPDRTLRDRRRSLHRSRKATRHIRGRLTNL